MDGLTRQELQDYRDLGYVVRRALFDADEVATFDRRFAELVDEPLDEPMKVMRDVMVVKGAVQPQTPLHGVNKLMCFEEDPQLFAYCRQEAFLACLKSILGDSVYSLSTNVFNKPPGVDGRHPFHQDLRYFRIRPADAIVGTWTALKPATRESGCLAVVPASHRQGLVDHDYPDWEYVNKGFFAAKDVDVSERVYVELAPGDTLFFHPLLLHGSGRNRSDGFRRAISAHFAAADAQSEGRDWRTNVLVRQIS